MTKYQSATKWLVPNLKGGGQANEKASPERLAYLVDYTDKSSNFFEDLEKLDRLAQSIEDEVKRIDSEEEGSKVDP